MATYRTKDGIVLKNVPEGTSEEAIKERINQIRSERQVPTTVDTPIELTEGAKQAMVERGMEPVPAYQPERPPPEITAKNILGAAVEPMMQVGSGLASSAVGGIAGLTAPLWTDEAPADVVRAIQEAGTYQPRIEGGQRASETLLAPLELIEKVAHRAGEKVAEDTDSPAAGATTKTAINAIAMALGGKAVSGKPLTIRGKQPLQPVETAIRAPGKAVGAVSSAIGRAGKNIFPRHAERSGRLLTELAGEDAPAIVAALESAKAGETAGQATTGVGRAEFAGLEKLMAQREPTPYGPTGRIREAQQAARRSELGEIARTPEELAVAEAIKDANAARGYGAVRGDLIDPRSNAQILRDTAQEAQAKAVEARASKGEALRDQGRFKTVEAQQEGVAQRHVPVPGQPRIAPRYTPQRAVSQEAGKAAAEAEAIAGTRRSMEEAHTSISENMLLNMKGETGAPLSKFLDRPSVQSAIESARNSAAETGAYFPKNPGDKFSVGNLQRIKRAIAENLKAQKREGSLGKTEQAEITSTLKSYTKWLEGKSEGFKRAEAQFKIDIEPVTQMKIGQELQKALEPRLGAKDRTTVFVNALENSKKIVKKETGMDMEISEILTPEQMKIVDNVRSQIDRDVTLSQKAGEGYKKLTRVMGEELAPPEFPGMLSSKVMVFRNMMNRLRGHASEKTMDFLTKNWDKPKELARIMKEFSPEGKQILQEYITMAKQAAVGSALIQSENQ